MGNQFFHDVDATLGHTNEAYNLPSYYFDPTTVGDVSDTCVDVFSRNAGVDYSSISIRSAAAIQNAFNDEAYKEQGISKISNLGCEATDDNNALRCDWSNLYSRIITECQIANLRGVIQGPMQYYEGNCEELLGISPKVLEDGILNPNTEWCPSYYDGKEGSVVFASLIINRTFVGDEGKDSLTDLLNKTIGINSGNSQTLVIDNVPYCTAFDSCTAEDFFKMANAAAASFAQHQTDLLSDGGYDIESYQISIIPDTPITADFDLSMCKDSSLKFVRTREKEGTCEWVAENSQKRCAYDKNRKHCPKTCGACEEFMCVDSPRTMKLWKSDIEVKCEWVKEDPDTRCKTGTTRSCRETCGFCNAK